ncbi:MAG: hypothetical protein J2P41_01520, partial [Blastocatellia bacterium]|nr:hypothetical protein [Blastocatellia bacterium]
GFSIKRIERDGAQVQDGIEIGSGEHLSNVRVIVGYGSLTLRGEVKVIGGTLPPHIGIYVNLNRISDSESGNTLGTFVDGRGQFIYQNLVPGDYEVRLISLNYQPGEPRDKPLVKLIYNTSQKLSLGSGDPPPVILVIDLSKKESDQ